MTTSHFRRFLKGAAACALLQCLLVPYSDAQAQGAGQAAATYTAAQAAQGRALYQAQCAACHGDNLEGLSPSPALTGRFFTERWVNKPADQLASSVRRMPPTAPDSLTPAAASQVTAYLLQQNGITAGATALPDDVRALSALVIPAGGSAAGPAPRQAAAARAPSRLAYSTNGPLLPSSRLDKLTPVTDAMLRNPPAGDWLTWRRTGANLGHSPLTQITKSNVEDLELAWSWSLPDGPNMMTPIVHDGVLFAYSSQDVVQAFDAASGELLWGYQRALDADKRPEAKKGVAIYEDKVVFGTTDIHLVALEAKTGRVVWDHAIDTRGEDGHLYKTAPIIANGKAIFGLVGRQNVEGGNPILAVDMKTGKEVWRFYTIARPGELGGDSWNGQPLQQRTGGSVWVPGSFDPELNLVYFGAAPTYNTQPLRKLSGAPGVTNDALYTNSTMALNADTGRLVWQYQHMPNDQWDHDWAFERQIVTVPVNGVPRKAVITGGKIAIFDAVDAATGEYLFSLDMELQNVVSGIDPKTGRKIINPAALPEAHRGFNPPGICPDFLGARNHQSGSYNPDTGVLFLPLNDTCVDSAGKRWQKNPDPKTDGLYGIVRAIDLKTRKVVWSKHRRGPQASAYLTTATGLLFTGTTDRWFQALDQDNGNVLWQRRLNMVPNSFPVTYMVDGKQYVAVVTSPGSSHTRTMSTNAKINVPPNGSTLWVFALPDRRGR